MIQMDMVVTLQTSPNLCENLYLIWLMSFLNLKVLKGKPTKFLKIMPHLNFQKICFWDKEIVTHMNL
jgi:hypothetical protein